ncbi:hypothetical protein JXO59_07240 [candidate division KSB1 bacterium]|nr:hypothetical protein [candidate division KSB1 bacterium]
MKNFRLVGIMIKTMLILVCLMIISCDEKLPPRIQPGSTMQISAFFADPAYYEWIGGLCLRIYIAIENTYEETFHDTVSVGGQVRIWWERRPEMTATVPLSNYDIHPATRIEGDVVTMDPGEKIYLECFWNLITDDGQRILDLLDYGEIPPGGGQVFAKPEVFKLQASVLIFEETGHLESEIIETTLEAWKIIPENPERSKKWPLQ